MRIINRLFPYPVLCMENDDYFGCNFDIEVTTVEELNDIVLKFEIKLDNKELLELIRTGQAAYVIHMECSYTSFREILRKGGTSFEYKIPKNKVNRDVWLVGMVVSMKKIDHFYSGNFHEDYDDYVSFEKGAILAYKNLPRIVVIKNYEELAKDNSYVSIIKRNTGQNEAVTYDISEDKIKIFVDESIFDIYTQLNTDPQKKPILDCLILLPALSYVVQNLQDNGDSDYLSCGWYQKIKKSCELRMGGKDFMYDIINGRGSTIEVAQELLNMPIKDAFISLRKVAEE